MKDNREDFTFMPVEDDVISKVVADFKASHPANMKNGFALALNNPDGTFESMHIHYGRIPDLADIAAAAADYFYRSIEGAEVSLSPKDENYPSSREKVMSSILSDMAIVDVFAKAYLPVQELEVSTQSLDAKIGQKGDKVCVKVDGKPEGAISVSIPHAGRIEIKPCPFCGKVDLMLPSLFTISQKRPDSFFCKAECSCGAEIAPLGSYSPVIRDIIREWDYDKIIRHLIYDCWNKRS